MDITKDLFEKMPLIEIDLDEENKDKIKEILNADLGFKVPIWPRYYDPRYEFCLEKNENINKWHRLNCFERVLDNYLFDFSGSEYNQVSLWDSIVRFTIHDYFTYYGLIFKIDRNTTYRRTKILHQNQNRPDFLFKYHGYLLFKGEEKANDFEEAKEDLKKAQYFDFDLLACYAAAGSQFQLFFLLEKDKSLFEISPKLNLNVAQDRLRAVIFILNICRVLHYQTIKIDNYVKNEKNKKYRRTHSVIDYHLSTVKKRLNLDFWNLENCQHVWSELIAKKNIDGIVKCYSVEKKEYQIQIKTKKLEKLEKCLHLNNEEQLLRAIRHITNGLKYLHDNGYVHTDLRWSNVLFKQEKYYLIDFDKCLKINHEITRLLPHMPSYLKNKDVYTIQEDFYQIGFEIIGNCGIYLNKELLKLKFGLENKVFKNADEILKSVISLIDSKNEIVID